MGLFSKKPPPNTISDARWARIQRGAHKAQAREHLGMFSDKAVRQRKQSERQRKRSLWS